MRIVGVIPARFKSTRLNGNPLADILGKPGWLDDQEALYWLGETLQAEGKVGEARDAWQQAVRGDSPIPGTWPVFQALAMKRLGRAAEADDLFAKLLQAPAKETASAQDFYVAGVAQRIQGRENEACSSLRRALELDPFLWQARLEADRCDQPK